MRYSVDDNKGFVSAIYIDPKYRKAVIILIPDTPQEISRIVRLRVGEYHEMLVSDENILYMGDGGGHNGNTGLFAIPDQLFAYIRGAAILLIRDRNPSHTAKYWAKEINSNISYAVEIDGTIYAEASAPFASINPIQQKSIDEIAAGRLCLAIEMNNSWE